MTRDNGIRRLLMAIDTECSTLIADHIFFYSNLKELLYSAIHITNILVKNFKVHYLKRESFLRQLLHNDIQLTTIVKNLLRKYTESSVAAILKEPVKVDFLDLNAILNHYTKAEYDSFYKSTRYYSIQNTADVTDDTNNAKLGILELLSKCANSVVYNRYPIYNVRAHYLYVKDEVKDELAIWFNAKVQDNYIILTHTINVPISVFNINNKSMNYKLTDFTNYHISYINSSPEADDNPSILKWMSMDMPLTKNTQNNEDPLWP